MNLRNLKINDVLVNNKSLVIDGINELDIIIMDNYHDTIEREIGIEFNIGSRLGEPKEYLIVYVNPDYKNNPYIFILKNTENGKVLVKETTLESFQYLADLDMRKEINKALAVGFKNLPKFAFLSMNQINEARNFAEEYDDI